MSERKNGKKSGKSASLGSASPMDMNLLERLVKLMAANDLSMLEVRDEGKRVVLKRGPEGISMPVASVPAAPATPATPAAPAVSEEASYLSIKSPMVGTFYSSSSPDAKPFVSVGMAVDEDTDVCIIEAMKVFNNIKAECRGTIAKILINNGQTVEFGQTLFLVKPS